MCSSSIVVARFGFLFGAGEIKFVIFIQIILKKKKNTGYKNISVEF